MFVIYYYFSIKVRPWQRKSFAKGRELTKWQGFTFLGQKSNKRPFAQNNGLPHSLSKWLILKAGSAFDPKANAPLPLRAPP